MKRALSAVLMLLSFMFLTVGCATSGPKPETAPVFTTGDTRSFFGDTVQFERQGKAGEIMDKAEELQKRISKEKNDSNVELSLYRLYVKADPKHDHVITEGNAAAFWKWYQNEFDAHIGSIKWR